MPRVPIDGQMPVESHRPDINALPAHEEAVRDIAASAEAIFDYIDRPERLSAHMGRRSWHLLGSTMTIDTDEDHGRRVGSRLTLRGGVLGIPLHVDAVIVARVRPTLKVWQTVGDPHLLVIGAYRMGITIEGCPSGSRVSVSIDYALPRPWHLRWLARLLGRPYARWCVQQMVTDLKRTFADR